MLMGLLAGGGGANAGAPLLYDTLNGLSLTANLKLCVDSGARSTPTTFTAFPFPTQTGSANTVCEIWGPNAQPSWADAIHKASAKYTILAWLYYGTTTASTHGLCGDDNFATAGTETGFRWVIQPTTRVQRLVVENAGANVILPTSSTGVTQSAWNFVAVSCDVPAGASGGRFYLNGAADGTFDATYGSPAAGGATMIIQAGGLGNNQAALPADARLACLAVVQGAVLSNGNLDSIYAAMRGRFGV